MEERHRRLLIKQNPWWQDETTELPEFERDLIKELLKYEEYKQIICIIGLRRVGKTILMKQIIQKLNASKNNICYISFDDIDFQQYRIAEDLINYFLEFSNKNEKRFLYLDEIQKLPNWADLLKVYYDIEENLKIFVSGSASLEIKEYKETLAGRILTFHLPILTFKEFVRYFGMDYSLSENLFRDYDLKFITQKERYKELFELYLIKGAFPELLEIADKDFIRKYIKESVVEKAISDISKIALENEKIIYELFRLLVNSNAQLFEIVNLASILKINRNLVSSYLTLLEKTFLIKISYNFTASISKQVRASKKQYCAHSSVVIALLDYPIEILNTEVAGHLVEATIANNLENISFWRTPHHEIDFIIKSDNKIIPIEVKYKTRIDKSDIKSILKFMEEFHLKKGYIITKDLLEQQKINENELIFIPAWLFLLMNSQY
jgi:hypothetical protein